MKQFSYLAELVDPRSHDGGRFSYQGTTFLPVSYECDWMTSNEDLQRAVAREISNCSDLWLPAVFDGDVLAHKRLN